MIDLELMERAAKAAGIEVHRGDGWQADMLFTPVPGPKSPIVASVQWNPLDDDGDALRLAVALGISLDRAAANRCWTFAAGIAINGVCEEFYRDGPYAATRRAIVRAAAALADAPGARDD